MPPAICRGGLVDISAWRGLSIRGAGPVERLAFDAQTRRDRDHATSMAPDPKVGRWRGGHRSSSSPQASRYADRPSWPMRSRHRQFPRPGLSALGPKLGRSVDARRPRKFTATTRCVPEVLPADLDAFRCAMDRAAPRSFRETDFRFVPRA